MSKGLLFDDIACPQFIPHPCGTLCAVSKGLLFDDTSKGLLFDHMSKNPHTASSRIKGFQCSALAPLPLGVHQHNIGALEMKIYSKVEWVHSVPPLEKLVV
jgi:hypothetical protein